MRTVINGSGVDSTTNTLGWLGGENSIWLATLYLIGEPDSNTSLWMTDWNTALTWSWWGTFYPANITRGSVSSKQGFEVGTLDITWNFEDNNFTNDIQSTSPLQQAYLGKFDGVPFRAWNVYMPSPGDCNTFGASELFGGRIGDIEVSRGVIKFTVNSFLDVVNQEVPGLVVERLNTIAGYKGATPPTGLAQIPTFSINSFAPGIINATCLTPTPGQIFSTNAFQGGFIYITSGPLVGMFSSIETNFSVSVVGGGHQNQFLLYAKFPWNPFVGDTFYASATYPINQADGSYLGFPYIPDPSAAL